MSMTWKEAIDIIENKIQIDVRLCTKEEVEQYIDALTMACSALRPVSREQVEKVWRVGAWETVADEGFVDTMGRQVFHLHCPVCDFFWRETGHKKYFRFCPHCGAPMTDEAVQMAMERLEALKDDSTTD